MLPIPENQFMLVMMTDVELKNGASTKMMTIFDNSNIGYEEIYIGIRKGLEFVSQTKSMTCQLFSIENGTLKENGLPFEKLKIKHWQPQI
jgi:hypothetical protein